MEVLIDQEGRVSRDSHTIENPYFPSFFSVSNSAELKVFFPLELHRRTKWGVVFSSFCRAVLYFLFLFLRCGAAMVILHSAPQRNLSLAT